MGLYKVPVEWRERGYLLVHASTQKEAAKVAMNGLDIYPLHNQPIGGSLKLAFPEGSETEYIARVAPGLSRTCPQFGIKVSLCCPVECHCPA